MKQLLILLPLLLMGVSAVAQTKPTASTSVASQPKAATPASVTAQPKSPASTSVTAQTKSASATPAAIVSMVGGVTGKRFLPDTTFAALTEEDETLLAKEPIANWGLAQEANPNVSYYNLIIGTRSYQVVIVKLPTAEFPRATLLRYTTPKSKPEPIARGTLQPKVEEKAK